MGTTEKLKIAKEILAMSFMNATEKSAAQGLQFGYTSYPSDDIFFGNQEELVKGWIVDIKVKELGYGERDIQQFRYPRPDNIDAKNMEYHVILDVMSHLIQGCLISWYEVAKMLSTDAEIQKAIRDEATENNFITDESE